MYCCGGCFKDTHIKAEINLISSQFGNCGFCGATDVDIVLASEVSDLFEMVCSIYEPDDQGRRLVAWLIEDWQIFSMSEANAQALLVEILDDGERVRQNFSPSELCTTDSLNVWEVLRSELRTKNRFFPDTEFDSDRMAGLLSSLIVSPNRISRSWFRARIEDEEGRIPAEKMGAPPAKRASAGRANPAGIPYLYVGSDIDTAMSEVRPHPGECLTVASIAVAEDLQLVDLRNPRSLITPFIMEDTERVASLRGDIEFLERLGEELTTPVLPHARAVDYIPSQYLCELIKKTGYDGVVYSSSVSEGVNLALFEPSNGEVGTTQRVRIDKVEVSHTTIS